MTIEGKAAPNKILRTYQVTHIINKWQPTHKRETQLANAYS